MKTLQSCTFEELTISSALKDRDGEGGTSKECMTSSSLSSCEAYCADYSIEFCLGRSVCLLYCLSHYAHLLQQVSVVCDGLSRHFLRDLPSVLRLTLRSDISIPY
ncbi:unnamed protein product [Thelazia callipaeda]|uniref:Apple domain-containing protein n=1 Tax=Thelazia callipaeda TaxID=103827 RepID=A0A0N5CQ48_THECL|nr:unnamed protein product [Thelazia callipaeda]